MMLQSRFLGVFLRIVEGGVNAFSVALLAVSVLLVCFSLSLDCNVAELGGTVTEAVMLILALLLLYIAEGFQVGLLGVRHMTAESFTAAPKAFAIKQLVFPENETDFLSQLFLGQSFLVVLASFLIAQITTFPYFPSVSGCPPWVLDVFVRSGLPGVIMTVNLAQLLPSTQAQRDPRRWLNTTPCVYSAVRLSLLLARSGLLHCTYALCTVWEVFMFRLQSCRGYSPMADVADVEASTDSNGEDVKSCAGETDGSSLYRPMVVASTLIWGACAAFLCYNIAQGRSLLSSLQPSLIFVLVVCTWILVFYCEGLKVAVVGTSSLTRAEYLQQEFPLSIYNTLHGVRKEQENDGDSSLSSVADKEDVSRFLLGRQMIVVPCGFLLSNIFHFSGYGNGLVGFLLVGLGLPAMLATMQLAQLAPQVLAGRDPRAFLSLPLASLLVRFALCVEKLGLTRSAFLLSHALSPNTTTPE